MNRFLSVLSITYSFFRIAGRLIGAWLSLGWNVRKARKSFEAELIREGISKQEAERLSECFSVLKDQMLDTVKSSFSIGRKRQSPQTPRF